MSSGGNTFFICFGFGKMFEIDFLPVVFIFMSYEE